MNFRQIVQRFVRECGISTDTNTPSSVAAQTGRMGQAVDWCADAYSDVLTLHPNWEFLRGKFTLQTVAGTGEYAFTAATDVDTSAAISAFRDWARDTRLRCYLTSSGRASEGWLSWLAYQDWYHAYNVGNAATQQAFPREWSRAPSGKLIVASIPDAVYTVSGDYFKAVTALSLDADEPVFHSDFHMIVVYRAMKDYGPYIGAPEVQGRGDTKYIEMLHKMESRYLPEDMEAEALA